jgi:hypothetical protein
MKLLQTFISILLFIICLFLMLLCKKEKQKQDSLRKEISQLSSNVQEETPASQSSTSSANKPVPINHFKSIQDKELKKIQRRNSSNNEKLLEDNRRISDFSKFNQDITWDELRDKDPKAYENFLKSLQSQWQQFAESREAKVRLLESLNPNVLSQEEFEEFCTALQERIHNDEYNLAFQRKPLPKGLYYGPHGSICSKADRDDDDDIPPPRIDVDSLMLKYCANAVGLDFAFVKALDELNYCLRPRSPMRVMPYFTEYPK